MIRLIVIYYLFHIYISTRNQHCSEVEPFFENELILYIFGIHTAHFVFWFLYSLCKPEMTLLSCMILYENVYNYTMYRNTMCIEYFRLTQGALWMFTSPLIICVYAETNKISVRKELIIDFLLHATNTVSNLFHLKYALLVMMYALYGYNIYNFWKHETTFKYGIMYGWIIIGINESLYRVGLLSSGTYIAMTYLNDMQIKSIIFGHNALKRIEIVNVSNNLSISDIKNMNKLSALTGETKLVLSNVNMEQVKQNLSDRVICDKFSERFVHKMLVGNNLVRDVVILFSDIVNYTKVPEITLLQKLYQDYDSILQTFHCLQKVENIGDCYMVTSLLDKSRLGSRALIATSAVHFAHKLHESAYRNGVQTRVGLHVGDVQVGIIGSDVPRFGVVGHAVNYAARLESACEINGIHMSVAFKRCLDSEGFNTCDFQENKADLKHIGKNIKTYSLKKNTIN